MNSSSACCRRSLRQFCQVVESFNLAKSVVVEIQLFQRDETLQTSDFGDEILTKRQALYGSK